MTPAQTAFGGARWQAAASFRQLCATRARNYPAGRQCMVREALVQSVCGTVGNMATSTASTWTPPLSSPSAPYWTAICTYACADLWIPFMADCLQYATPLGAGVKAFNNTCVDGRRRAPDAITGMKIGDESCFAFY